MDPSRGEAGVANSHALLIGGLLLPFPVKPSSQRALVETGIVQIFIDLLHSSNPKRIRIHPITAALEPFYHIEYGIDAQNLTLDPDSQIAGKVMAVLLDQLTSRPATGNSR